MIRELPREQKEMASHYTVDELPAREAAAFGNISKQIITHINRTADACDASRNVTIQMCVILLPES